MKMNIQKKLFLLFAGLTIVILVVVLLAINAVSKETITDNVIADFRQTQGFFKLEQSLIYDRLVESAYLIQESSLFKANVQLDDAETVYHIVNELALLVKTDLFVVTNADGKLLAWLGKPEYAGADLNDQPSVSKALKGEEPPLNIEWPELWYTDGALYEIVTVPIYQNNQIIGAITLGSKYTSVEARDLKQNTSLDVILFYANRPFASSNDSLHTEVYRQFAEQRQSLIDSVLTNYQVSDPFRVQFAGIRHFAFLSPLGKGEPAFYLASVPVSTKLQILDTIQTNIFYIAVISILVTIPLAIFLGRIFSKPIHRLTDAMSEVRKGNLSISVSATTEDEIGLLTQTFNNMIVGLQERFVLQKYVGNHTLKMIRSNPESKATMGGTRHEMAIVFTDIRDSTVTIEQIEPEHFVSRLNKFLGFQSDYVSHFNGSIDKFIGDSMVALFEGGDALKRAVKCGVAIQTRFKDENRDQFFAGLGVGINYGSMVLGNMGAYDRLDYTIIGPEVNLCARLCTAAKPGQILLPKKIVLDHELNSEFTFEDNSVQKFKGFTKKFEIVEVIYGTE